MSVIRLLMKSKKKPTVADYKGVRVIQGKILPEDYELQLKRKQTQEKALQVETKKANEEVEIQAAQEEKEAVESRGFLDWIESVFDSFSEKILNVLGIIKP